MKSAWYGAAMVAGVLLWGGVAEAAELKIQLNGTKPLVRETHRFQCDAKGAAMGLPAGVFSVEYINGSGNSLAILPVGKDKVIFANVLAGSGAKYMAGRFTWWDAAGRGVTFESNSLAGDQTSVCHNIP